MSRKNKYTEKIDKIIGSKVHELRISMGWSRQQLASKIKVTHQQLQKYEKGVNRISVGRIADIAKALNKPVIYFFEDIDSKHTMPNQHHRMCIEVSRNFMRIKSAKHQETVHQLAKNLAEG